MKFISLEHHLNEMAKIKDPNKPRLDPHVIRLISATAQCAPQPVVRVFNRELVRPLSMHRIRGAIQQLGLMHLFPHLETIEIGRMTDVPGTPEAK